MTMNFDPNFSTNQSFRNRKFILHNNALSSCEGVKREGEVLFWPTVYIAVRPVVTERASHIRKNFAQPTSTCCLTCFERHTFELMLNWERQTRHRL